MPLSLLKIKADLENISRLVPVEGNLWKLLISNGSGDEKEITVSSLDVIPLEGSKGEANFVMKWPGATSQSYIKLVEVKKVNGNYQKAGEWETILGLECRNLEVMKWIPSTDFVAESSEGKIFSEGVDLSDDWADYDEENDLAVSITVLEHKIERG